MQFGQTLYVMPPAFSKFRKLFNKRRHCFFSLPLRYVVAESDFLAAVGKAYTSRYARPSRARGLHKMRLGNFGHENSRVVEIPRRMRRYIRVDPVKCNS